VNSYVLALLLAAASTVIRKHLQSVGACSTGATTNSPACTTPGLHQLQSSRGLGLIPRRASVQGPLRRVMHASSYACRQPGSLCA
jgi:hypothetical protein